MPIVFDGIAGFDVNRSYVFHEGILAIITLIGSGVEDGESRARARQMVWHLLSSVLITFLSGVMLNPKVMELKPQVSTASGLCSL